MSSLRHFLLASGLAVIGTIATIAPPEGTLLSGSGIAVARESYICMTDDGYGRKRSCSASYKAQNPNWRGSDNCYTDDGYGRRRQCSASYNAKHQK
jgi:hypothetical protein